MSRDLLEEAEHLARVTARQTSLVEEAADEHEHTAYAFNVSREGQRRPYGSSSSSGATIIPFPRHA